MYARSTSRLTGSLVTAALAATLLSTTGALAQTNAEAAGGGLRVGAMRIDISPPEDADHPALGEYEHERLYLRAIVIDNGETRAALLGGDLGGVNEEVWAETAEGLAAEFDIPIENIVLSSTHTHSDWPGRNATIPTPPRWGTDFLAQTAMEAVAQAIGEMRPATVGYGVGESYLNVNRDAIDPETALWTQAANFDAVSDREVDVLAFIGEDGEPIAAYVAYGMHPVSGYLAGFSSGDFPAATSRYVEQAFGDDMVTIFSQSPSGDQNPRWLRTGTNAIASRTGAEITGFEMVRERIEAPLRQGDVEGAVVDPDVARELADYMHAQGVILGEEVIRVMSHIDDYQEDPEIWGRHATLTCPGRTRLDDAREGVPGEYEDGPDVDIRLGVLAIGDMAIATTNAEVYTEIGQRVDEESPMSKLMYVTIANGRANSGYIPDEESFTHQTFQVLGSDLQPGCAERGIADGIADLVSQYLAR